MTQRVYRDLPDPLYAELVKHAEHRDLTVPALIEELARHLTGRYHPDGTPRETFLAFPRLPAFIPHDIPVIDRRSGMARPRTRPRNGPPTPKRHTLDDPEIAARFKDAVNGGALNSDLATEFHVSTQTIAGWRERLGLPSAGSAEGRQLRIDHEQRQRYERLQQRAASSFPGRAAS